MCLTSETNADGVRTYHWKSMIRLIADYGLEGWAGELKIHLNDASAVNFLAEALNNDYNCNNFVK